ncbi:Uncharacterised protein [Enterobacter cloacae]|nr:Uncharacterised protein [Enterobacter cloacae]
MAFLRLYVEKRQAGQGEAATRQISDCTPRQNKRCNPLHIIQIQNRYFQRQRNVTGHGNHMLIQH